MSRYLLVSDGVPHGLPPFNLPEMNFGHNPVAIVNAGFYSTEREGIITQAGVEAGRLDPIASPFVMTTGYGAVSILDNAGNYSAIRPYNVPGQNIANINNQNYAEYFERYRQTLINILPQTITGIIQDVSIVWYAGKSYDIFRNEIGTILLQLQIDQNQTHRIHACVYGVSGIHVQHPQDKWRGRWGSIEEIFENLNPNYNNARLVEMQTEWNNLHAGSHPFFEFI